MDLYIDRDALSRGLARVQSIIERRNTHPQLAHVLLSAKEGALRMTATDSEVAYIGDHEANVEKPGDVTADASSLFQIIRALPEPTVHITQGTGNRLEIRSGRAFFRLPGGAAEDYPALPAFDPKGTATLSEGALRRMVEQTSFAVAQDDVRFGLNGTYLEEVQTDQGAMLRIVGTDGHRLAAAQAAFEGELVITPRTLVPRKALSVMKKLLENDDDKITLSFGEGAVHLTTRGGSERFWFRLIEGEFPDYKSLLSRQHKHRVMIRRDVLASALRRVIILVQDRARAVQFAFDEGELRIDVRNADRGEVKEELPIELEGEAITAGFNARYLQDVLGAVQGERIVMELPHPLAPCLVRDPDDEAAFFIVMPMRLD